MKLCVRNLNLFLGNHARKIICVINRNLKIQFKKLTAIGIIVNRFPIAIIRTTKWSCLVVKTL